jgi:DNA-directed RNA polymerase specialized sigma24 family protein
MAANKRGGGQQRVPLDEALDCFTGNHLDILAVHEVLGRLAGLHARQGQVVELRFFGSYTMEETAGLVRVSVSTVESDHRKALAFLRSQLSKESDDEPGAP